MGEENNEVFWFETKTYQEEVIDLENDQNKTGFKTTLYAKRIECLKIM